MEKPVYYCVFYQDKKCSVKTEYKLKPESLVEFCKLCQGKPLSIKSLPNTLRWYELFKRHGYKGEIEELIEACLTKYFDGKGWCLPVVVGDKEKILHNGVGDSLEQVLKKVKVNGENKKGNA